MVSPIIQARGRLLGDTGGVDLVSLGAGAATASGDTGFTVTDDVASETGRNIRIETDTTDNDCGTASWGGAVVMAVGTRFGYSASILHTEGSTNAANWFIGFSDVTGATFFGDTGALATMDAIGIYKVETSMFFRTCANNATTQSGETTTTAYASATRYNLRVEGEVGTLGYTARFYVDEVLIDTVSDITITNMSKMVPVVAVANGAGAAEILNLFSFIPYGQAL